MTVYDITRRVSSSLAVWPGDTLPEFFWSARIAEGSSVNVGRLSLSTHTGTHVDAPLHYQTDGAPVDAYTLEVFIGPAQVIDVHAAIVTEETAARIPHGTSRLLVRTGYSELPDDVFEPGFTYFDPAAIRMLADRGVRLIGTDAPSFDPATSTDLPAHHALSESDIANIENLQLSGIKPGFYTLVALPLRLQGMDAAPVRAVLLDNLSER